MFFYGEVGEWSNPADCKSAAYGFEGSNPSLTTTFSKVNGSIAQSVEQRIENPCVDSSILSRTTTFDFYYTLCECGGIGRRAGLKIPFRFRSVSSILTIRTTVKYLYFFYSIQIIFLNFTDYFQIIIQLFLFIIL